MSDKKKKQPLHPRDIIAKHPEMFKHCFDFMHIPGWMPVIEKLVEDLSKTSPLPRIAQIKEKWGGLRCYLAPETDEQERLVRDAERKCSEMCEQCGEKDATKHQIRGWVRTVCYDCLFLLKKKEKKE